MRVRRAPEAEVYDWADPAGLEKCSPVRAHITHPGDKVAPGLGDASLSQVIDAIRVPERGTEAEPAVVTHAEAPVARAAVKQVIAVDV